MTNLPAIPPDEDLIDRIAKEVAAQVAHHIETMYPDAARAVAWSRCSRSIQGVVRNAVAYASRAAEAGTIEKWLNERKSERKFERARWKAAGVGLHAVTKEPS